MTKVNRLKFAFLAACTLMVLIGVGMYFYGYRAEVTNQFKAYASKCYSSTMTAQVTHSTNGTVMFVSTCRSE